ncbi:hypothetical protein FRC03_008995 [Tulasnella sp. 419]|nr:hypothetical protein FRC03_008995 [Tulasnella sp. 419]
MFRNALDLSDLNLSDHTTLGKQTNRGGYSDIFQGELLKGDERTKVAIKVLRVQGSGDSALTKERLHKRFHREVLLWKQLQHPNVVPLLGYMMLPDGSPALISPWYTNGNVIQYIGSQESPDRKSLALDVIRGLEYLHSISVAHGDLKGENVLVDASGRASLCDFGMSQFLEAAARITGFTTTNAHLGGTDRFMSPELFYELPKSTDTDIWALGCLIVQILTDEMPYHHIVRKQMITFAILRGDPPMSNSDGVIDEKLWGCIKDCWRMDPAQRPSASAMKSYFEPPEPPKNAGELLGIPGLLCGSMLSDLHHYTSWIEFSPDGRFLAAIGPSGDISILEVEKHRLKLLKTWSCADATNNLFIWKIAWSTSQRHLLVASHSCARIFLVETGELLGDIGSITAAAFFPNSPNIAFVQHRAQAEGTSQVALQYIKGAEGETSQCIVFSRSIVDLGFIDYKRVVLGSSGAFYGMHPL